MRSARAVRSPPRRPKPSTSRSAVQFSGPGSWARGPEQPLTEGGLEKPCLDGFLVVVLANHSNAVITKQQSRSLQRGLRNRRKKQPAPLIELGEEFLGTQHRAGRGMRLDPRRGADHDARARDPNALPVGVRRRKRDGPDGGAEAKILRHLEPREVGHPLRHRERTAAVHLLGRLTGTVDGIVLWCLPRLDPYGPGLSRDRRSQVRNRLPAGGSRIRTLGPP